MPLTKTNSYLTEFDEYEQQNLVRLAEALPLRVREDLEEILPHATDITFILGYQIEVSTYDGRYYSDLICTPTILDYISSRIPRFKDNGRSGLDGTLHRFARITGYGDKQAGLRIRLGRYIPNVANKFNKIIQYESKSPLDTGHSIVLIGPPGVGKTVLLRGIAHLGGRHYGASCAILDSSNEIGGEGLEPHPAIKPAMRFQVNNSTALEQARTLSEIIRNHTPKLIILDELVLKEEIEIAVREGQKGVRMVASIHGLTLIDALNNPDYSLLFGEPNRDLGKTMRKPLFSFAIELLSRNHYRIHKNLRSNINAYLKDQPLNIVDIDPSK